MSTTPPVRDTTAILHLLQGGGIPFRRKGDDLFSVCSHNSGLNNSAKRQLAYTVRVRNGNLGEESSGLPGKSQNRPIGPSSQGSDRTRRSSYDHLQKCCTQTPRGKRRTMSAAV